MRQNALIAITEVRVSIETKTPRLKAKIDGLLADGYYLIGTEGTTAKFVLVFAKNKQEDTQ